MRRFFSFGIFAFAPICRKSQRSPEALDALKQMGVKDVSLENKLEVRAEGDTTEIVLIGAIGKSWWDDSGITEQEVRDAIKSSPKGKPINILLNSEGGSVKEGLGIYNAIKDRNADIQCRITGYALSIASVFPLAAKKSLGGRGVVSPKSAIWMEHKAWSYAQGNADDMRQAADMLDTHDETLVDIYAAATGKTKAEIRTRMEKETWTKGGDAIAAGLADESDDEGDAKASYRPLHPDFISRCKNISPEILNCISALPRQGEQKPTNKNNNETKVMNKAKILALLAKWGVKVNDNATDDELAALVEAGKPAAAKTEPAKTEPAAKTENEEILAQLTALKRDRINDKISPFVDDQRITKAEAKMFIASAMTSPEAEAEVMEILAAKEAVQIGGDPAGAHIVTIEDGPAMSKNGVQGSKIIPELDNLFAATLKDGSERYAKMKAELPRLLRAAFKKDAGVMAANTFSGTVTTNFLIMAVIQKLANRFAAANLFTRDNSQDPFKPLALGIQKFNTTATDGSQVETNLTDWEAAGGDSTIAPITITPAQYTSRGHLNNSELNSGFRIGDIIEKKLIDLAAKVTQVLMAPITVANFTTNGAVISAPAAFGLSDLANLQGILKKTLQKNLILDGEYIARIANTPGFFQPTGNGVNDPKGYTKFGWDNIALNTDWSGAGANVRGFGCGQDAIGIISGLPLTPPEGIPGNIVQQGVAMLPDVGIGIQTNVWFSPRYRTFWFSFDIILGATLVDETQGVLVKSA